jgi:hypothetical protein
MKEKNGYYSNTHSASMQSDYRLGLQQGVAPAPLLF